ncbi:MAG TPA: SMP-30/gluconolactonase/LRE family protein, partial [Puia sp.]|nr:SMP-30/gluconolactonase/LRE family protein [Puia sp.]
MIREILGVAVLLQGLGVMGQQPALDMDSIAAEGMPRLVSRQFSFTEGASVDRSGNVFFTDQPNDKIWEYTVDG